MNYLNSGIYAVVNLVNNKRYIGQAVNFNRRKSEHFGNGNSNIHLQRAMAKYGRQNFEFIILEYIEPIKEKLDSAEQRYLDFYKDRWDRLYNISPTAGSTTGCKLSEETRKKLSEVRKNMSDETKMKMSQSHKGKILSEEHRKKISDRSKGRVQSEETRKKLSEVKSKKVNKIDKLTGEILVTFNSGTEAAKNVNGSNGNISKVCLGEKKSAYGYKWQFATIET